MITNNVKSTCNSNEETDKQTNQIEIPNCQFVKMITNNVKSICNSNEETDKQTNQIEIPNSI